MSPRAAATSPKKSSRSSRPASSGDRRSRRARRAMSRLAVTKGTSRREPPGGRRRARRNAPARPHRAGARGRDGRRPPPEPRARRSAARTRPRGGGAPSNRGRPRNRRGCRGRPFVRIRERCFGGRRRRAGRSAPAAIRAGPVPEGLSSAGRVSATRVRSQERGVASPSRSAPVPPAAGAGSMRTRAIRCRSTSSTRTMAPGMWIVSPGCGIRPVRSSTKPATVS